jgi:hypothetical protein
MHLEGQPAVIDFDPFQSEQAGTVTGPVTGSQFQYVPTHHPGEPVFLADGRVFRYAVVNGSNPLVAGTMNTPAAEKANHYEISPTTAVTSSTTPPYTTANQVTLTLGATAAVLNEYAEGFLNFSSGANVGISYQISYNPVALSSATTFTVTTYDFFQNAIATSDTVDLVHNQWQFILQSTGSSDQTIRGAGVCMIAGAASYGVWVATKGLAACIGDGTVAVGTELVLSNSTAGALTGRSTTYSTAVAQIKMGVAGLQSAIATNAKPVLLSID